MKPLSRPWPRGRLSPGKRARHDNKVRSLSPEEVRAVEQRLQNEGRLSPSSSKSSIRSEEAAQ
jgi:hypothetical protein